jgi:hypothetical protein
MDGARGAREKNLTFSQNDTGAVASSAQATRAILLASAMATTLNGRRSQLTPAPIRSKPPKTRPRDVAWAEARAA